MRLRDQLRDVQPFACLYGVLLAVGLAGVLSIGGLIGDCEPGRMCGATATHLAVEFGVSALIAIAFSAIVWVIFGLLRGVLPKRMSGWSVTAIFIVISLILDWCTFDIAGRTLLAVTG